MRDWKQINKARCRINVGVYCSDDADGFNGMFSMRLNGLPVRIIASDGMGWEHVSVSIIDSNNTPSWSMMCKVKDMFFDDEHVVVQFHPKKTEYVHNHPGCLHLWRCLDAEFPTPAAEMVGLK